MIVKTKIKEYPDGSKKAYVFTREFMKDADSQQEKSNGAGKEATDPDDIEYIKRRNLQKTKAKINDYIRSNDFDLFVTLTFKDDRNDDTRCFKRLDSWLRYMRKKHGKFDYILIPERHKDGALHFHGVFGGFGGELVHSGGKYKNNKVYNLKEWRYGFTNVSKIRDKLKTASYVTKYIVKDLDTDIVEKGKKKYWSSRGLRVPVETYYSDIPFPLKNEVYSNESVKIYNL